MYDMGEDGVLDAMRVADLFAHIVNRTLSQRIIAELTDDSVSLAQVQAMRYVWLHNNVLMGDLAEGLAISYPSATNMVKRLERQGLVERLVNPVDRREVEVRLTSRGSEICECMENERVSRVKHVLEAMEAVDRRALMDGLSRFVVAAAGDDDAIAQDVCLRCGVRAAPSCPIAQTHILSICR
jgi:DNA-binding MarR family transcriptional regulator